MIVYLDLVIITNILINFAFISLVNTIFKDHSKLFKTLLGSIIGCMLIISFLFNYWGFQLFKLFGGLVICLITFKINDKKKLLIKTICFYIVNYCFVGVLATYNISNYLLLLLVVIMTIVLFIIENNRKYYIFLRTNTYNVMINFGNKKLKLSGYLDTGNFSCYKNKPIIYVSNQYQVSDISYQNVLIDTAGGSNVIKVYEPQAIVINDTKVEGLVAFIELQQFECLLNVYNTI